MEIINTPQNSDVVTLLSRACTEVHGFTELYRRLERRMHTQRRSESTKNNYARHLSQIALHFQCLPTILADDQIEDYLEGLILKGPPSASYFKHTVYSLRYLFRLEGLNDKRIQLPSIKRDKKLPIVLGREEVKAMIKQAEHLKHKLLVALLYGCGLRCGEVRTIRLRDIDINRGMLLVRKTKGNYDRYVPLGKLLIRGIQQHIESTGATDYLFTGSDYDSRYSQRGVQWVIKSLCKKAGIRKEVNTHTLRHTYATHLLEDGLDIVSIKELLGHAHIETTMMYLHIAKTGRKVPFCPLDNLYHVA
ncbi:MAG: tyrosine-type recombinase/integrase [Gammaproteobacteria bacterium]